METWVIGIIVFLVLGFASLMIRTLATKNLEHDKHSAQQAYSQYGDAFPDAGVHTIR